MRELMRRRGRNECGAAAVEFALVVPVLLVIVIGIFNFGFVLAQQISLNNGARQAARYAVVYGPSCADVATEARNGAETIGMSASQVPTPTVSPCPSSTSTAKPCAGATPGTNVTVTMARSAAWTVTFPPFNVIPAPTLTGKGVMRCEYK